MPTQNPLPGHLAGRAPALPQLAALCPARRVLGRTPWAPGPAAPAGLRGEGAPGRGVQIPPIPPGRDSPAPAAPELLLLSAPRGRAGGVQSRPAATSLPRRPAAGSMAGAARQQVRRAASGRGFPQPPPPPPPPPGLWAGSGARPGCSRPGGARRVASSHDFGCFGNVEKTQQLSSFFYLYFYPYIKERIGGVHTGRRSGLAKFPDDAKLWGRASAPEERLSWAGLECGQIKTCGHSV